MLAGKLAFPSMLKMIICSHEKQNPIGNRVEETCFETEVLFETQTLFETKLYSKEALFEERIWFSTKWFEGILETLTDG